MSHCWWIKPIEKLAWDTMFLCRNKIRGSNLLLLGCLTAHKWGPLPSLPLTGVKIVHVASPPCCRQDVCQLSQEITHACCHPGLLANQTLSDEYCRPSRYKLRLRRLGTDCLYVWYCFVFSMLWILILSLRLNKVCIGLFVFIPT